MVDALLFGLLMLLFSFLGPFGSYAPIPEGMTGQEACEIIRDEEGVNTCTSLDEGMLGASEDRAYYIPDIVAVLGMVAAVSWFVLIYVVWQGTAGATPGKWLLKVRVVDENGQPPGLGRSAARSLLWIADAAPYVVPLVGPVAALMSTGHRRVGDMVAQTYVVGLNDAASPVQVPGEAPSQPALQYESPLQGMPAATPAPTPSGHPAPPPGSSPVPPAAAPQLPGPPTAQPSAFVPAPSPPQEPTSFPPFDPATDASAPPGPASPAEPPAPPSSPGQPAPSPTPTPTEPEPSERSSPFASLTAWSEQPGSASEPGASQPPSTAGEPSQPSSSEPSDATEKTGTPDEPAQPVIPVGPTRPPIGTEPAQASGPASEPQPSAQPQPEGQFQPEQEQAEEPVYQPQWDAARGAYIQWDPDRGSWLQWDDAAQQWHRIG